MEAARLPMICFEPKVSIEKTEFSDVLLSLIVTHFQEEAGIYRKECSELDQLRVNACNAATDFTGCSLLKRYYCQLCFLVNRFPFLADEKIPGLKFHWEDVYAYKLDAHSDLGFEKAAIMYNIGALHSMLGRADSRTSADGMKISCTHFQCAAWAFANVRDNFRSSYAADWSNEILSFQESLMLAQSQECILEKSMADNRKASITAKVAVQCADFYQKSLDFLEKSKATSAFTTSSVKMWKKHMEIKLNFHRCVTFHYRSIQAEETQKYGERLAFCQAALERLADCQRLSQGSSDETQSAIQFINDVVSGSHTSAKKDNDFVYHEKVPDIDSLPNITGAVLVKGIGFDVSDKEISGPDIFAKLVPMEAHEASSLYSEEKAQLLRTVGSDIEAHDTMLDQYLSSLQIDPDKLLPEFDRLPDSLVEKCAAVSLKPETVTELSAAMQALSGVAIDTEADMNEVESLLKEETEQDAAFQTQMNVKRSRLPMFEEIESELSKCRQAYSKASLSNQELHKAMAIHMQNLKILASPLDELKSTLPDPQASLSEEDIAVVQKVKHLFGKINEMKHGRNIMYTQLRDQVLADDITKKIVTRNDDDQTALFTDQLKKHDNLKGLLQQNMGAQSNILDALTEANVKFVPVRQKIDLVLQQRNSMVEDLIYSYDVYKDLLDKQSKGLEFYEKLKHNVGRLLERARPLCKTQQEERQMIIAKMKPKDPPPVRPTANKPVPSLGNDKPAVPTPKSSGPPKLKDYLPFMKSGGDPAAAIAAADVHDDGFADLDDVELPEIDATPKLKDFLPFRQKGNSTAPRSPAGMPAGLSDLPPEVLKYMPATTALPARHPMNPNVPDPLTAGLPPGALKYMPGGPIPGSPVGQAVPQLRPANHRPPPATPGHPGMADIPAAALKYMPQTMTGPLNAMGNPAGLVSRGTPGGIHPNMMLPNRPTGAPSGESMHSPANTHAQFGVLGVLPRQNPHLPATSVGTTPQHPPHQRLSAPHNLPVNPQQQTYCTTQPGVNQPFPTSPEPSSVAQPQWLQNQHPPGNQRFPPQQPMQQQPHKQQQQQQPISQPQPTQQQQQRPMQQHPGQQPTQPGQQPIQPGQQPIQPGQQPIQPGQQPILPGQHPMQPGQHPMQPRQQPMQPRQQPMQPGQQQQQQPIHQGQQPIQPGLHPMQPGQQQQQQPMQPGQQQQQPMQPQQQQHPMQPGQQQQQPMQPGQQQQQPMQPGQQQQQPTQPGQQQQQPMQPGQQQQQPTQPGQQQQQPMQPGQQQQQPMQPGQQQQQPMQPGLQQQQPMQPGQQPGQQPVQPGPQQQQSVQQQQPMQPQQQPQPIQPQQRLPMQLQQQQQNQHPQLQSQRHQHQEHPYQQQPFQQQQTHQQLQPQPVQHPEKQPIQQQHTPNQQLPYQPSTNVLQHQDMNQHQKPVSQPGQTSNASPQSRQPSMTAHSNIPGLNQQSHPQQGPSSQGRPPMQTPQGGPPLQNALRGSSVQTFQGGPHMQTQQGGPPVQTTQGRPNIQQQLGGPLMPGPYAQLTQEQNQFPNSGSTPAQPTQNKQSFQPTLLDSLPSGPHGNIPLQPLSAGNSGRSSPALSTMSSVMSQPQQSPVTTQQVLPANSTPNAKQWNQPSNQSQQPGGSAGQKPVQTVQPTPQSPSSTLLSTMTDLNVSQPETSRDFVSKIDWSMASTAPKTITNSSPSVPQQPSMPVEIKHNINRSNSRDANLREPYADENSLETFISAVERYHKQVDSLTKPSLKGPTPLDKDWKELSDEQELESRRNSMAAGMSESTRNRNQDCLPYDKYRVVLSGQKNDYINASLIENLPSPCPRFIATQGPLNQTEADFWLMVIQQRVEIIVMLSRWTEMSHCETVRYWPRDRADRLSFGNISVSLQLANNHKYWIERKIIVSNMQTKENHTVTQLQFTGWTETQLPENAMPFLLYVNEVIAFHKKQKDTSQPVLVHCGDGSSKTGVFCTLYSGVASINLGLGIIDVFHTVGLLRQRRRGMVHDVQSYLYCYTALLYYAQDILVKRGILTTRASFGNPLPNPGYGTHGRTPSADFIMADTSLATICDSSAKMGSEVGYPINTPSQTGTNSREHKSPDQSANQQKEGIKDTEQGIMRKHTSLQGDTRTSTASTTINYGSTTKDSPTAHPGVMTSIAAAGVPPATPSPVSAASSGVMTSGAPELASLALGELQNPNTFEMGEGKQRISKADFYNPNAGISKTRSKTEDPFNDIDPLWSLGSK